MKQKIRVNRWGKKTQQCKIQNHQNKFTFKHIRAQSVYPFQSKTFITVLLKSLLITEVVTCML